MAITFKYHRFANLDEMRAFALEIARNDASDSKVFAEAGIYSDDNNLSHRAQVSIVTESVVHVLRWNAFCDQPDISFIGQRARREARDSADWFTDQVQSALNSFYAAPAVPVVETIEFATFDDIAAAMHKAIDGMPAEEIARLAKLSGSRLNLISRAFSHYGKSKDAAGNFGLIGVGTISFAQSRLETFCRRINARMAKAAR